MVLYRCSTAVLIAVLSVSSSESYQRAKDKAASLTATIEKGHIDF